MENLLKGRNHTQSRIIGLTNKIEEFSHPIKEADEWGGGESLDWNMFYIMVWMKKNSKFQDKGMIFKKYHRGKKVNI